MDLPSLFLADLPAEATLTPSLVSEACLSLRRNRARHLAVCSTQTIIRELVGVAEEWLRPDNRFRQLALKQAPEELGFSEPVLAEGLDHLFAELTAANLAALIEQDLGHAQRLDELCATPVEQGASRASVATAPELLVHITAGNIPAPAIMSMVTGLLVRSAQFVKCATGGSLLPRLFAHSVHEANPRLGSCLEVAEWKGGETGLEEGLFAEADCVSATGSDETLAAIHEQLGPTTQLVGHGDRASFGFISPEVLSGLHAQRVIADAARDIVAWDQLGCLSPHVIYVEEGGELSAREVADKLAAELDRQEAIRPRGKLRPGDAATITSRRGFYEVRAANSDETRIWQSQGSTAWTVVYEADPLFQLSCLNRFVYVKSTGGLEEVLRAADAMRGRISTVGMAASPVRAQEMATTLARWGVPRVCPLGQMQRPPLTWRHDGRPTLTELLRWTDWEF